jgi:hypothetical protein
LLVIAAIASSHAQTYSPPAAATAVRQVDAEGLRTVITNSQIDAVRRTALAAQQFELERRGMAVRQAQGTAGAADIHAAVVGTVPLTAQERDPVIVERRERKLDADRRFFHVLDTMGAP